MLGSSVADGVGDGDDASLVGQGGADGETGGMLGIGER
jgi:hypothetical protein